MNKKIKIAIGVTSTVLVIVGGSVVGKIAFDNAIAESYDRGEKSGIEKGKKNYEKFVEDFKKKPHFDTNEEWNTDWNRMYLEHSLENDMMDIDSKSKTYVSGAACFASAQTNRWHCVYRETGDYTSKILDVEVNPKNGDWKSF